MNSKCIDYTTLTIIIIGAINWGLIGFFNFNLVAFLFGQATWISRVICNCWSVWTVPDKCIRQNQGFKRLNCTAQVNYAGISLIKA